MILIRIHSISKPDRWYKDLRGHIFTADLALFGYWIRGGKNDGKLVYSRDAVQITSSDIRKSTVETFSSHVPVLRSKQVKVSENRLWEAKRYG